MGVCEASLSPTSDRTNRRLQQNQKQVLIFIKEDKFETKMTMLPYRGGIGEIYTGICRMSIC